jgi:hypothetical protein
VGYWCLDYRGGVVNLYVAFTIAGWTFEFSVGFTRSIEWALERLAKQESMIFGHEDEDGNFVPEGVAIEDDGQ